MARSTPRVERECLACGVRFIGTPKATRCPDCRASGRKVPSDKQSARRRTYTCIECGQRKPVDPEFPDARRCEPCSELLGLDQIELSPGEEERRRAQERLNRVKERLASQAEVLKRLTRKPEGKKMTSRTTKLPVGLLWLEIVAGDGRATSVAYTDGTDLSEDQYLALLLSYHRLRCKGFEPHEIAKLCPVALLQTDPQSKLSELPRVELDPAFTEDQRRADDAGVLGLSAPLERNHCKPHQTQGTEHGNPSNRPA